MSGQRTKAAREPAGALWKQVLKQNALSKELKAVAADAVCGRRFFFAADERKFAARMMLLSIAPKLESDSSGEAPMERHGHAARIARAALLSDVNWLQTGASGLAEWKRFWIKWPEQVRWRLYGWMEQETFRGVQWSTRSCGKSETAVWINTPYSA